MSVRSGNAQVIWHGILGLTVDSDRLEYRDVCTKAVLLYDAATRLKVNPEELFRRAKPFASPSSKSYSKGS